MNHKLMPLPAVRFGMVRDLAKFAWATFGALLILITCGPVFTAKRPNAEEQEYLVKSTLMSFNDANVTGLYDVLLAKTAAPFRDQFTAEKLAAAFKDFVRNI